MLVARVEALCCSELLVAGKLATCTVAKYVNVQQSALDRQLAAMNARRSSARRKLTSTSNWAGQVHESPSPRRVTEPALSNAMGMVETQGLDGAFAQERR